MSSLSRSHSLSNTDSNAASSADRDSDKNTHEGSDKNIRSDGRPDWYGNEHAYKDTDKLLDSYGLHRTDKDQDTYYVASDEDSDTDGEIRHNTDKNADTVSNKDADKFADIYYYYRSNDDDHDDNDGDTVPGGNPASGTNERTNGRSSRPTS